MKLLNFAPHPNANIRLGVLYKGKVLDVPYAFKEIYDSDPPSWFSSTDSLIKGGDEALNLLKKLISNNITNNLYGLDEVIYYPAVMSPEKILCVFLNYEAHTKEAKRETPKEPYIFSKLPSTLIAHKWPIELPKASKQVDYEAELAVIIGKRGKYIQKEDYYKYIFGYTIFNDVSFRDRRQHAMMKEIGLNFLHAKSLDGAGPIGPWIVTRDEIADPHNLTITLWVNDEIRQNDNTRSMIFKIPEIIEYITNGISLKAGDVISTGTPSGTALATGKFLKDGDTVKIKIENIGELINPVKAES
ncbi:MAG: fumarylacetoacetate hydrolase family protein [Saccharolobus sp.]|uniref:Fumarylacetoacetate hydrolase family protein n=1 Tax=Saccharolobus shibatae (strain ATCC 51178 / DSM 5389 / JCM 8931 / NBRC 15437 / B12) TaxID=523848 RepID=A0A8F5BPA1_SACSH|nr:fumarylacetoacetate hydrolase family protein [Saccharolobus shibatae]MCH4815823.1 fumarylacetoacetate hydrolase family protein [Saccharolobus shibatae]QXJ28926.1 Fumarylacetoacetate hydrolase family protein [Saccharolobus shibatae B12]